MAQANPDETMSPEDEPDGSWDSDELPSALIEDLTDIETALITAEEYHALFRFTLDA